MVNFVINHKQVSVAEGTTIMEAAQAAGIPIPHLCYLKHINEIAACRVCVVEVQGKERLITACNNVVEEGMVIFTNSPKVRLDRRRTVQLILSQHDCKCATCVRSGNCALQVLSNDLNIQDILFEERLESQPWNPEFPLIRNASKCIKCMRCIQICDKVQGLNIWDFEGTGARSTVNVSKSRRIEEADCSLCGQCITHCPVGALRERDDTEKLWEAIADPDKTVVVQVAPAVRAAWGEALGIPDEEASVEKIFDGLRKMGADYVFDTSFSADLTIMEEANEFLERFRSGELEGGPMFTSCCPGWVRYVKSRYPDMVGRLSTAKSPMQMFGATMKTHFADQIQKRPEDIFSVAVMPCVAKKGEQNMELFYKEYAGYDTDCVITTRELVRMLRSAHIRPETLEDAQPDMLFKESSGAGVIFGATGGVMEAALRTAHFALTGENCAPDAFKSVRAGQGPEAVHAQQWDGVTEAEFELAGVPLKIAVVSGLGNTGRLLDEIRQGKRKYDFVEVMACPGGCVGGGGQPIHDGYEPAFERGKKLYFLDEGCTIRHSHENPDIKRLYEQFYEKPNSHKAHRLLHTDHERWKMP